jgi:hypothetical protein
MDRRILSGWFQIHARLAMTSSPAGPLWGQPAQRVTSGLPSRKCGYNMSARTPERRSGC